LERNFYFPAVSFCVVDPESHMERHEWESVEGGLDSLVFDDALREFGDCFFYGFGFSLFYAGDGVCLDFASWHWALLSSGY